MLGMVLFAWATTALVTPARADARQPLHDPDAGVAAPVRLTPEEGAVLVELNQARADRSRAPLGLDPRLVRGARAHTAAIVETGVFAHGKFWTWIQREGVTAGRLGETLGWSSPVSGAASRIVARWLVSPEHRAILLDRTYDDVGVGVRTGPFMGHADALVVTADFHGPG